MTLHPSQAWTLRRLLTGQPVDGEKQALPEPFQAIARRLADLPPGDRKARWEGFLDGREDRDEIVLVLADVDPEAPQPEQPSEDVEAGDDWGPIRLGTLPPAEPFPVDVFPEAVARLVIEGAKSIGCPHDFLAVPALVVAAGVIGRSVSLMLKNGYFVPSSIFAAFVGPPSDGKTPGCEVVARAIKRIDETLASEYAAAYARWEEAATCAGLDGKKSAKPSAPPRPRRIDVDDITMEAIPPILADNPRGLLMIRDELTSLMLGMNQFKGGKGNDRPALLKIWSGGAIKKDRVNHAANAPIRCSHPCLSIMGGLPPDMLGSMADPQGRADGFLDRFLFAYPESLPVPDWSWEGVPEEVVGDWCELVDRLWSRSMNVKEGRSAPHVAYFSPDGKEAWDANFKTHTAEMNAHDFPLTLRGPWGKLREYAGRLALILACMDQAADPTADPTDVPRVGRRVVENAWRLVAYFKSHARRVHAAIGGKASEGNENVRSLLGWIGKNDLIEFSERDIARNFDRFKEDPADLADALDWLASHNLIRRRPDPGGHKPGRKASPAYQVNPAFWKSPRFRRFRRNPEHSVGNVGSAGETEVEG